jgi:F-type H+-transporting ATPase subunit c
MTETTWAYIAAGIGTVGTMFCGALGIAQIARSSVESIARQPEAAQDIRGVMIITAAMIEGVTFLALIICFLLGIK